LPLNPEVTLQAQTSSHLVGRESDPCKTALVSKDDQQLGSLRYGKCYFYCWRRKSWPGSRSCVQKTFYTLLNMERII